MEKCLSITLHAMSGERAIRSAIGTTNAAHTHTERDGELKARMASECSTHSTVVGALRHTHTQMHTHT